MLSATPPISASASDRLCPVPVELSRGRGLRGGLPRQPYVNDRPYAASSFLSVAIADLFRSAIGGRSRERPELAETAIPLEVRIAALPCRGGEPMLRRLFEPLGYAVTAQSHPDEREKLRQLYGHGAL